MKKKLVTGALLCAFGAVAVTGGTLAYFSDVDAETNTFTTGNVNIRLDENFGDNNPNTPEKLLPAVGSAQAGTLQNGIKKEVYVVNTGSEKAFVRTHIAIPQILDDGADTFDASANLLHFNYDKNSVGEGKWDWSKTAGAPYEGNWNFYTAQIDGIWYNVYVVTHEEALNPGVGTVAAMNQVYLDSGVTNKDVTDLIGKLGANWHIKVVAECTQATGFGDAYTALNTAFGVPGEYTVDWSGATGIAD